MSALTYSNTIFATEKYAYRDLKTKWLRIKYKYAQQQGKMVIKQTISTLEDWTWFTRII